MAAHPVFIQEHHHEVHVGQLDEHVRDEYALATPQPLDEARSFSSALLVMSS
jgi:hypothetical protein